MKSLWVVAALLALTAGAVCSAASEALVEHSKDLEFLLEGGTAIGAPGVPGPLCVFGEKAFPVVTGRSGKAGHEPVVAAAYAGRGRIVAFGHGGYFGAKTLTVADTGRLTLNAVRWAAGPQDVLRVAVRHQRGLLAFLKRQGIQAVALNGAGWEKKLDGLHVVCVDSHRLSNDEIAALRQFVHQGGGLVTAGLGWGWSQLNPQKDLRTDHPGNRLLGPDGIIWADGYLKRTTDTGYAVDRSTLALCHAAHALDTLVAHTEGKSIRKKKTIAQAVRIATHAARALPPDDTLLLPRFKALDRAHRADALPSPDEPLGLDQPLARLALTLQMDEIRDLPPGKVKAHPAATAFPGALPKDATHHARMLTIDTRVPAWHSTGCYAAPGAVVQVTVPPTAAGKGLVVRIGAHKDHIWQHDAWRRCPEVTRRFPVEQAMTPAANAFGGLVYIEVPDGCTLGTIRVKLGPVYDAPRYVLGTTSLTEWRKTVRHLPAPWAELETKKLIITVPSRVVRTLDDPETLMTFWDTVMDRCAELAARPIERTRPERYVADTQISVGYMHAGYPIMTHLDAAKVMVDKKRMVTNTHGGVWGLFHEMGHNHQHRDWTFKGAGEVTVNLFTLYVLEKACGWDLNKSRDNLLPEARAQAIKEYIEGGANFEVWKKKPFLALLMYIQMQQAFGWDAFQDVFAEYRDLPDAERPKTDDEKRDQWMVRFSRRVGRNLGPFFEAWGVPTSKEACASIAELPDWMPEGFPPQSEK